MNDNLRTKALLEAVMRDMLLDLQVDRNQYLDEQLEKIREQLQANGIPEMPENVRNLQKLFWDETDRGCALAGGAFLDEAVRDLLQRSLVDEPTTVGDLFRSSGPLGSFSVRIDLCFLLGLTGEDTKREMHLIRRIRNDFAHCAEEIDFESPSIAGRCAALSFGLWGESGKGLSSRRRFIRALITVLGAIHARTRVASRPESENDAPDPVEYEEVMKEFGRFSPQVDDSD